MNQYERALNNPREHEALLNKVVAGKKTRRGFANAIHRVWCEMSKLCYQNPDYETFCKKGHDCPDNTYHVSWESMPHNLSGYGMFVSNEKFYVENYWSFSMVVYES